MFVFKSLCFDPRLLGSAVNIRPVGPMTAQVKLRWLTKLAWEATLTECHIAEKPQTQCLGSELQLEGDSNGKKSPQVQCLVLDGWFGRKSVTVNKVGKGGVEGEEESELSPLWHRELVVGF